jgi:hypothetical protein
MVNVPAAFDWSQVASANLTQYVANLRTIECPKEIIREIILAVVNEDYTRRRHAIFQPVHERFWELMVQPDRLNENGFNTEDRSKELRSERDDRLGAVLGKNWKQSDDSSPLRPYSNHPALCFLPEEKRQRWAELDAVFLQRQQDIYQKTQGSRAEQKAQLEAMGKEQDEARRQLLTGAEFQEYKMRISPQAMLAQNLAGFEATEDEYRALNQLRAATSAKETNQFNAQARVLLGEERFANLQRAQDLRFTDLLALAQRCQIPMTTMEFLYQQRVNAEQQSALVRSNPSLSAEDRQAMLLAIQSETRQQLLAGLGPIAGEAYLRHHGNWLEVVNKGNKP